MTQGLHTCLLSNLLFPLILQQLQGVAGEGDGALGVPSCRPQQCAVHGVDDSWQTVNGCLVDQHGVLQQCITGHDLHLRTQPW